MSNISYPDSGSPFEDAAILRNAVYFSTAQRAHSALSLLQHPLGSSQTTMAFLLLRAFEEFMTSTEDLVGWLFALQQWKPGDAEYSLFLLLDRIMVGKKAAKKGVDYTEARAVSLLSNLDEEGFRTLIHIPTSPDLLASGMPKEQVDRINRSMPYKLEGWRRMAGRRAEQDRGWVRAFNKVKHHLLAFPTRERGKYEVWLPSRVQLDKRQKRVNLGRAWLENSAEEVRRYAGDAVAAQTALHDTLALILVTRYREEYSVPQWAVRAFEMDYPWRQANHAA